MKKSTCLESLFLIVLILIFLILEISFIKLPGIYCDEADVGVFALQINNCLTQSYSEEKPTNNIFVDFFTKRIPYLCQSHLLIRGFHGALDSYILAVVFSLFSVGVVSMRLLAIFLGAATILATYFFTKEFFNKNYALLATFLLVISPGFIMGTKTGMDKGTILLTIYMTVLFCFLKWYRLKKDIYFYLAMFLLGLGMWTRIWFFWFVFGLFVTAIIFNNDIKQRFEINRISKFLKYIVLGGIFFCLGCSIFIYNELMFNFSTVKYVLACFRSPSLNIGTHNNLQYFHNFSTVISHFQNILTGAFYFGIELLENDGKFINMLCPWAFLISVIYLLIFSTLRKDFPYRKNILFLLTLFIGMLILTPISHSLLPWYHFYFFYPLVQLIISVAIVNSIKYFRKLTIVMIVILAFSFVFIIKEINGVRGYFYYLKRTGGKLYLSPVIYDLTKYLIKEKTSNVVAVSWGLQNVIDVASGGKIQTQEAWPTLDWEPYLCKENNLFVYFPKEISPNLNNVELLFETAVRLKINLVEKKRFYDKSGRIIYVVMEITKAKKQ